VIQVTPHMFPSPAGTAGIGGIVICPRSSGVRRGAFVNDTRRDPQP